MGIFSRSTKTLPPVVAAAPGAVFLPGADDADLSSALAGLSRSNEDLRKSLDYDGFGPAFDNGSGGYYAREFDIASTPARLKSLYIREPWVYAATTQVARTLSSVPLRVVQADGVTPVEKSPLLDIINAGARYQSGAELKWVEYVDLALAGNSFIILEKDYRTVAGVAPVETVVPRVGANGEISDIQVQIRRPDGASQAMTVPYDQVVHLKMPNPYSPFFGLSIFMAAARSILVNRYRAEYDMAFYLRGATAVGVIESQVDVSTDRFKRLMLTFEQLFTGRANWWRTLFLLKGQTWKKAGLTMQEMQHLELMKENRREILSVVGVPGSLVGVVEDVNRATAEQQERIFWTNTIVPMAKFVGACWTNSYVAKVKYGGLKVVPDFSGIDAVEGFAEARKAKADAMAPFFTINEIREAVWKAEPLAGRGDLLVAELTASVAPDPFGVDEEPAPEPETPEEEDDDEEEGKLAYAAAKAAATTSQNRIESRLGSRLRKAFDAQVEAMVNEAVKAVIRGGGSRGAESALVRSRDERRDAFMTLARKTYEDGLESGFISAAAQVKRTPVATGITINGQVWNPWAKRVGAEFPGVSKTDREAIDVLREKTRDGERRVLVERAISRFEGLDRTQTEKVLDVIADGHKAGLSNEDIARNIRDRFGEAYDGQARTIVRTEVLSAVSQGAAWNHDVLGEVFSEVRKQWLHQGDAGVNPDAREEHADFEALGDVESDFLYKAEDGSELAYPRDPAGSAGQVINCRCSMISVIPETATSNADAILETT